MHLQLLHYNSIRLELTGSFILIFLFKSPYLFFLFKVIFRGTKELRKISEKELFEPGGKCRDAMYRVNTFIGNKYSVPSE